MTPTRYPQEVAGTLLRSITSLTGALAGGLGVAVPMLAATWYEATFGRPSSTSGLAIPFAFIVGVLAAGLGAVVGAGIHRVVARTRWAGPIERRVATFLLMLVIIAPSVLAIQAVRRMEADNAPRVLRSTGEVARAEARSEPVPVRSGTMLWVMSPRPDQRPGELLWNGRRVTVRVVDDRLLLRADDVSLPAVDISRFDYARETYGVTAALSASGREWLALLVQLRTSGRRELLLIFNPDGVLVHEELLERDGGRRSCVELGAAGPAGEPQAIILDCGVPIRYVVENGDRGVRTEG